MEEGILLYAVIHTRLVLAEGGVERGQSLKRDRKSNITGSNDIVELVIEELGSEAKLQDDARELASCQSGIIFRFVARDDHLAGCKNQSSGLGISDTHDDSREALRVVLGIAAM